MSGEGAAIEVVAARDEWAPRSERAMSARVEP